MYFVSLLQRVHLAASAAPLSYFIIPEHICHSTRLHKLNFQRGNNKVGEFQNQKIIIITHNMKSVKLTHAEFYTDT